MFAKPQIRTHDTRKRYMKIVFIINVGRRDAGPAGEVLDEITHLLDVSPHEYRIVLCETIEESQRCLKKVREDSTVDALWIGGGDGTFHHVLNAMFGRDIIYGFVPMGTVNALVQALKIPLDPVEAVKYLLDGDVRRLDVGKCNETYFFAYASVGIHAAVFHNINVDLKKRWGKIAFWESGVRTVWQKSRLPRFNMEIVSVNEETGQEERKISRGYSFVLSNFANYAGFGLISDGNPENEGVFDLHSFRHRDLGPMFLWYAMVKFMGLKSYDKGAGNFHLKVRECRITAKRGLNVQADGEPITPKSPRDLEFRCLKGAVKVILNPQWSEGTVTEKDQ